MELMREVRGGEQYEYFPLGQHVVAALGVCGGRPTFKYSRLEVSVILDRIAHGEPIEKLVRVYADSRLTRDGIEEALRLASQALTRSVPELQPAV